MENQCKLSPENIAAIEEMLSSGKYAEVRIDQNKNIIVMEADRTTVAIIKSLTRR